MKKLFIPLFILPIIFFSCKKPQSFDYRGIKHFKIEKLGLNYSTVSMDLVYYNPNNFGVDLKKVDCNIFIEHRYVGRYLLDTTMHISKKSEFYLPSKVQIDMKGLVKGELSVLANTVLINRDISVKVEGTTKVGKAGIYINFPINYEDKFRINIP